MAKIKVDLREIEKTFSPLNFKLAKYDMMNQMLIDMQPFVPTDQGALQITGTIGIDGSSLHWVTPYAKAQFYGIIKTKSGYSQVMNYTTPGTSKRWDLRAKSKYGKDWKRIFVKGLGL